MAALLIAVACAGPPAAERRSGPDEPAVGGTAVVAAANDITGINPLIDAGDAFNESVLDALFLQLFEEQPDFADGPPTFAPALAAGWEWSDDRRTLTVELRAGVTWDDGVPVTADDVVWTWRLQTDERVGWVYSDTKQAIESVEAVDDRRLRVRFSSPSMTRLGELNQGHVLPRHRWQELPIDQWRGSGGWFRDNLVVNGPFRLASWQPDRQIELERNPAYYRAGYPRLDGVVFRIVPEPNNRLTQLLTGAVDLVPNVPAAAAARIDESPDARLETFWARQYNFIHWNVAQPIFAEADTRRALTQAVDRQKIVDTLLYGYAEVAHSPIISTVWAHRADPGPWPYDPAGAAELLAGLGWRDGDGDGVLERDGRRFSFELLTNAGSRVRTDAAVMIQEDLRRAGIEARVRQLEWTTLVAKLRGRDFEAAISAFNIDTGLDLTYAFHSGSIDDGMNFGSYSNPRIDRLIEAARASRDVAELAGPLHEIQGLLHDEQPLTFLWEPQKLTGVSRRLQGARPNPLSYLFRIEEWWLSPTGR